LHNLIKNSPKQNSGKWFPIAYFSQTTNKAEENYHSFELEMLAILLARQASLLLCSLLNRFVLYCTI